MNGRITAGISQTGGKYRLLNTILKYIPYHEFYLEPFLGSAIVLLNKPRCRYECGNDMNSEIINYLLTIRQYPKEFDDLKQGVFGLVSQEICNRIVSGELVPSNNIEQSFFFYYLNKLCFAGSVQKGTGYMIDNHNLSREGYGRVDSKVVEHAKAQYSGMLNNFALGTIKEKQTTEAKDNTTAQYLGIAPKQFTKANYGGLVDTGSKNSNGRKPRKDEIKRIKENMEKAQTKGINPKTTRPYTNNDCGLMTPLNPRAIERLRYVNLTAYPFQRVYKMFYEAFYTRKELTRECFLYFDPPYIGTEKYYGTGFGEKEHLELIEIVKNCPFHWLLSIGGDCQLYLDNLKSFTVKPVKVKYSTSANDQTDKQEFLVMNYDIKKVPKMIMNSIEQKPITSYGGVKSE